MAAKEALIKHLKCVDLTQSKQWLQPEQRQALAEIIIASFSNVDPEAICLSTLIVANLIRGNCGCTSIRNGLSATVY